MSNNLKPSDVVKTDINILLLGESGVGKSTFINSFANYLQYHEIDIAVKSQLLCLIPCKITTTDVNFKEHNIVFGQDNNEDKTFGNSSTQGAKAYVFPLEGQDRKIRLIDTPGIGDARGIEQDDINFENILSYISRFPELHAICFLLKPNVSVISPYFKFCIQHLMSRLDKSATKNIVFIYTNARCSFYRPAETNSTLRRVLDEIESNSKGVKIPFGQENMFCFDNEAFRYLVGLKNDIKFGDCERREFCNSWKTSVTSTWNMLAYICGDTNKKGLVPHKTEKTLSINETKRIIIDLCKPLADIADLIQDNLLLLNRHEKLIVNSKLSNKDLEKQLYIPCVNLRQKPLSKPVTVCTAQKCCEIYTISGLTKYHYKTRCHNPCYLTNVTAELIGAPELMQCSAMAGTQKCTQCGCNYSTHQHILYESELYDDKIEDRSIKVNITDSNSRIRALYTIVQDLKTRGAEYEKERETIIKTMAKFAHFLQSNSITIFNDAYASYIDYLIEKEKNLGPHKDVDLITRYTYLKKRHENERQVLEKAQQQSSDVRTCIVDPAEIYKCVKELYCLKHTGNTIQKLHKHQERERQKEFEHTMEYCHPKNINKPKNMQRSRDDVNDIMAKLSNMNLSPEQLKEIINISKGSNKNKSGMQQLQKPFSQHMTYTPNKPNKYKPNNQARQFSSNAGRFAPPNNTYALPNNAYAPNIIPNRFPNNFQPNNFNQFPQNQFASNFNQQQPQRNLGVYQQPQMNLDEYQQQQQHFQRGSLLDQSYDRLCWQTGDRMPNANAIPPLFPPNRSNDNGAIPKNKPDYQQNRFKKNPQRKGANNKAGNKVEGKGKVKNQQPSNDSSESDSDNIQTSKSKARKPAKQEDDEIAMMKKFLDDQQRLSSGKDKGKKKKIVMAFIET